MLGALVERGDRFARARVVDDDVDSAVALDRGSDELGRGAVDREVARHGVRVGQLRREGLEPLGPAGRDDDARAGRRQHAGEAVAEPAARAGDRARPARRAGTTGWDPGARGRVYGAVPDCPDDDRRIHRLSRRGRAGGARRSAGSSRRARAGPIRSPVPGGATAPTSRTCAICARRGARRSTGRAQEARFNRWPHGITEIDGQSVHFIHARSPEPDALPLVITHGWPGSVAEFLDIIDPLRDPRAHGGDPSDAFHVVCPSMPGYGWSGPTHDSGLGRAPHRGGVEGVDGAARIRALRRAGWRLGLDGLEPDRQRRCRARRRRAPQHGHRRAPVRRGPSSPTPSRPTSRAWASS